MAVLPPPARIIRALRPQLVDFIERLVVAEPNAGVGVNSWWRSEEVNRREGGERFSQHLVGLGLDLSGDDRGFRNRMRAAGLIVVETPSHTHVQYWVAGTLERLLSV